MIASACQALVFSLAFRAVAFGVAPPAFSQTSATLSVHVVDITGAPIARALVMLSTRAGGVRRSVQTDGVGKGQFDRIAPGSYLIEVDAEGFARPAPRDVQLAAGDRRELSIAVALVGFEDHVFVTASGTAQRVDELSKATSTVDRSDMDRRDDRSIVESLRTTPGVRIQQLGGPGAASSINIRGLRNEDTAVLIDGVRFRDAAATQGDASTFVSDLLIANPDRVEVLRGSGSSLYGSNAVAGVVNVITQSGTGPPSGTVLLEGGGLQTWRARGHVGGGVAHDRINYGLGVARLNVAEGVDHDDRADNTTAQGELGLAVGSGARFSARFYGAEASTMVNEDPSAIGVLPAAGIVPARPLSATELFRYESGTPLSELNTGDSTFIPSANDPDNRRESMFRATLLSFAQQTTSRLGYTLSYHRVATSRSFLDGPLGISGFEPADSTRSDFEGHVNTVVARANFQINARHLVTAGYEFERERYTSRSSATTGVAGSEADVTEQSHAAFVQDQFAVTNRLQLSAALRVQRFSLAAPRFAPTERSPYAGLSLEAPPAAYTGDASAVYMWPAIQTRARAHVGTGYRAPSLFERFGTSFDRLGYSLYGDPRLGPERSVAVDAGIDHELAGSRLRISATGFGTWLRDVIVFDFSGAINPVTDAFGRSSGYRTTDGAASRGLEAQIVALPSPATRIDAAYTYANAGRRSGTPATMTQASGIPRHQFSLGVVQRIGPSLQVSIDVVASSAHFARLLDSVSFSSRVFEFSGMRDAKLAAVYSLPLATRTRVRLFVRVDDLFGSRYFESGFRTPGRWATGGAAFEF